MASRPRLLVLTPDFPPQSGGIQLLSQRLAMHATCFRTRVVTVAAQGDGEGLPDHGLDVRRVRPPLGNHHAGIMGLNLASLIEAARLRPDVIVSMHIVTSPAAVTAGRLLRTPIVQYLYASEVPERPSLARFAVTHADAVIAISRHTERLAIEAGADPSAVHLVPPGVDRPARRRGVRADRPTVLTVSRLEERYKGHDVLVRALPLVRARVPQVEWVVVGDGPLRTPLETLTTQSGLQSSVRFTGAVSDEERDRWLDRAHALAMPSRTPAGGGGGEGFGIVYLEAGAHGLPVVGGNVGGALDSVVNEETGLLVDPTDHVAVADAITALLRDPERARRLGRGGERRAEQFAWPAIIGRVEGLLLKLAGQHA